ncbi:hypothetical protein Tco_0840101 [Tanacetum coccineum]|uniref:Uncharacterized protein n=1 Tax=Tanacetum coccineum TaxID=301880 RepID=A0ABQ5AX15_9ASTR
MAGLDFCSKHNMVAYLEKNDGNTEFYQIMDFLIHCSIHFALTVSPVVSTTLVEQFWMSAKSKTINKVRYITATFIGKHVTISEASIRSDLLFDDADGIDTLNNQAIFDTIKLMGPSPSIPIPDSNPEGSGGNHGAKEIKDLKAHINKKKARPVIIHHKAWMKNVSMKTRLAGKKSMQKKWMQKESVSKQGRKTAKSKPTAIHTDLDDLSAVYQLVMDRYKDEIPEGFDRVLWGDLMIMFNPSNEDEFWNSQQDWNVYPLRKKVLVQMLELKLESKEDNTMALELIRFVKKLIAELEPKNSDGDEKDF